MGNPLYSQLLSQASRLARLDTKRPKQGNLRRAISSAYYALFHCLIEHASRAMMGSDNDRQQYRHVLARSFQHGTMVEVCKAFATGSFPTAVRRQLSNSSFSVPIDLKDVAQAFIDTQEKRHIADYDLAQQFTRSEVLATIRDVDEAIKKVRSIKSRVEVRFYFCCLLAWSGIKRR